MARTERKTGAKVVIVGCDGQPASDSALRFGVGEADYRQLPLVLVTAYFRPVDPDLDSFDASENELRSRAYDGAEAALGRALGLGASALPPHTVVIGEGLAAHLLLEASADAVMIVVGRHHDRRLLLRRLINGPSTSSDLLHHARCPVVVVPPEPG
jgi:nucleotide-binding universal stress UspA family protein